MIEMNKEQEAMMIAGTLRMGFERDAGPGNSVNSTGNPWVIVLQGHFDMLKISRLIVEAVDNWHTYQLELARKEAENAAKSLPVTLVSES